MGRYVFPILFVIVLVSPFVLRYALGGVGEEEAEVGASNGKRLVIVTPHNRDILAEFERGFRRWHAEQFGKEVDLDFRSVGGTNDITKALADFYGAVKERNGGKLPPPEAVASPYDLVWGGGDFVFNVELEGIDALQAVELPSEVIEAAYPDKDLAGIALYDQDDDGTHWFGVCLSSFGIVYSPFVYDRLGIEPPTTWSDLTRPELHELLVLADPGKSGSAAVAYMMILQRALADAEDAFLAEKGANTDLKPTKAYAEALGKGWKKGSGDLLLMAANARYFTDSASAVPADVSHANAAAGTAIDFYGRVEEETVGSDRIQYVVPPAATAVTPDPIAVCYGTTGDDLVLARRFIEFLLSPQGQRLWIKAPGTPGGPRDRALRRTPIVQSVFEDQSGWTDLNNPFAETGGFNQRQEWMGEFTETRLVWQAAWIEAGAALDAAYAAVLKVPAGPRRDALIAQLRDLPVDWQSVQQLRADRKALAPDRQASFLAETRVELAKRFREHYRTVEAAAKAALDDQA